MTPAQPPLLITGATGTIGREVVRALLAEGHRVRAASRRPEAPSGDSPDRLERVAFDFRRPATHTAAVAGVERMFLVRPPDLTAVRREVVPFLRTARAAGVQRVVFLSVLGAERSPWIPHRRIELALSAVGFQITCLRAGFFMQNLLRPHGDEIRDRGVLALPAGHGRTALIDGRDIAAVAARVMAQAEPGPSALDLTGPEALQYHDVMATLSAATGRTLRYRPVSIVGFVRHQLDLGRPLPFALVMAGLYTPTRLGWTSRVTDHVARVLGRSPKTLHQFAVEHAAAWRIGQAGVDNSAVG